MKRNRNVLIGATFVALLAVLASLYTLYKIDPRRSGDVLIEVLGKEFEGVLGCDYFSAYRRYMRECDVLVQFCLAHLIRDVKFLMTLPTEQDRVYGKRLRDALKGLFGVIHQKDKLEAVVFQAKLQAAQEEILRDAAFQHCVQNQHVASLHVRPRTEKNFPP